MPTLRPQVVSGLVVVPTVDFDGGVWRVSIAVEVGASRTGAGSPPVEVVTREDLIVELIGAEGSFEPIASPDPGPLPVHALRGVQARGEYTFASGAGQPDHVRVRLRGQSADFPLADVFQPAPASSLPRPRFPFPFPIPPLRKPSCCPKRFEAPLNRSLNATAKSEHFDVEGDFRSHPKRCRCNCCEYRQLVRGTFLDAAGNPVRFDLPSGPLDPSKWREDGVIDEFGPGKHGYYGHRGTSTPGDEYPGNGCGYRANETPGCPSGETLHAEFTGVLVDVCRGRVVEKRTWVVDL
ncbi:MAG TPA: hypothetical protein VF520_05505 [Thermoleophilaceae bacterium]|jgi:hypothetical protein